MNKKLKTLLMAVSALIVSALPAQADSTVMCSVKANYQAGVDVNGNAVVPADINAPKKTVRIPLTVDLAKRMNELLSEGMKLEEQVGTVEIQPDGRVIFNGKDMTGVANVLCNQVQKQKDAALRTKDAPKQKKIRAAAVPADINAQPVEPVTAETAPVETPIAEPAPALEPAQEPAIDAAPAVVPAPEQQPTTPEPQVLAPAEPAPSVAPAPEPQIQPLGDAGANPVVPAAAPNEVVQPGGPIPRPPVDPVQQGQPAPDGTLPAPAPDDGMLSGGGQ